MLSIFDIENEYAQMYLMESGMLTVLISRAQKTSSSYSSCSKDDLPMIILPSMQQ